MKTVTQEYRPRLKVLAHLIRANIYLDAMKAKIERAQDEQKINQIDLTSAHG